MKLLALLLLAAAAAFGQTTATLSVTADGTQPFTYSWKKDGATIAGATSSSLVLSPLATTQTGLYAATVLNAAGSATAPANVIILGSSTTAPAALDLSKFTVQAGLAGTPYVPPVGQWQPPVGFAIVPLKKTLDTGNHWDDASSTYTVGAGEGGFYEIHMVARAADQSPPYTEIGITAGTTNLDDATKFEKNLGPDAGYTHFTVEHTNWRLLKAGDKVHCNVFVGGPVTLIGFDVTFTRKY